jgi:hypothetical protein
MTEIKNINDWEILTPSGWSNFSGIKKTTKQFYYKILFYDGSDLCCSDNHKIKLRCGNFVYASVIKKGNEIESYDKTFKIVKSRKKINKKIDLYDILNVDLNSEFFTNGIVSHNCAFIDNAEEVWTSAQQTMATGGRAILLSTPNGVGNFFHKTWVDAEARKNKFHCINLEWNRHPERDQKWRDRQTQELGPKKAAQECDCQFLSSGNTVVEMNLIEKYKKLAIDPVEIRGNDRSYWIWDRTDYSKNYLVSADVARGDGNDFSAFQVIEPETMTQVAEYKGIIGTKEYGNMLVSVATEYNNALLIPENASYGWAVIQQIIDRGYNNLFYSDVDLQYVDVEQHMTNRINAQEKKMTPGFTNSTKTRPLAIGKLETCMREGVVNIRSKRLLDELSTFIWNSGKAEAMRNYNDDLVISMAIGLWVRDTALRLRKESIDVNRAILSGIRRVDNNNSKYTKHSENAQKSWQFDTIGGSRLKKESLNWLL